jgi:hypothetical protein
MVRKLLGYRRFEELATARAISSLIWRVSSLREPLPASFRLAAKHRNGANVSDRYRPVQTRSERLSQVDSIAPDAKGAHKQIGSRLDPLKLLEEIRAVQAHLAALADGEPPPMPLANALDSESFIASPSSAWRAADIRPTFWIEAKPRYLRSLKKVITAEVPATQPHLISPPSCIPGKLLAVYAGNGNAKLHAVRTAWPLFARRLKAFHKSARPSSSGTIGWR